VGWKEARPFLREDRALLEGLAAQAALAIEDARRFKKVRAVASLRERERLAREIHDGPAQAVGYLHFRLKTLEDRLEDLGQSPTVSELAEMRKAAARAYGELRQSIADLRTAVSKGPGLIPVLTEWLREFSQQSGIPVELENSDARATRFTPEVEMQLLRVIQEALANVRKHAGGCDAWVRFAIEGSMSRVTVADNGFGFSAKTAARPGRQRFGLRTMRERAAALGGSLEVRSSLGKGTQVVLRMPLACRGDGQ
jgi:signal transduction histidine kinase